MSNLNRIVLVGRVVGEVELRYTTEGTALAKLKIAVERPRRSSGDQKSDVIPLVVWNKLAEICAEYLREGRLILAEGRIQTTTFDGPDGRRKYVTEVIVQHIRMLEGLKAELSPVDTRVDAAFENPSDTMAFDMPTAPPVAVPASAPAQEAPASEVFYTEDDIPF
jgi:single-strand DNA-binding protein